LRHETNVFVTRPRSMSRMGSPQRLFGLRGDLFIRATLPGRSPENVPASRGDGGLRWQLDTRAATGRPVRDTDSGWQRSFSVVASLESVHDFSGRHVTLQELGGSRES